MEKPKLTLEMELVPSNNWGRSLSNLLPKRIWDAIRKAIYSRYKYQCSICGATNVQVHCHEIWNYEDELRIQLLVGLVCLCPDCHNIKHWGRTTSLHKSGEMTNLEYDYLVSHFLTVNECTDADMEKHMEKVFRDYHYRSEVGFRLKWGYFSIEALTRAWNEDRTMKTFLDKVPMVGGE